MMEGRERLTDHDVDVVLVYAVYGDPNDIRNKLDVDRLLGDYGFDPGAVVESYISQEIVRHSGFDGVMAASLASDTTHFIEVYLAGDGPLSRYDRDIISAFLEERRTRKRGRHSRPSAARFLRDLRMRSARRRYAMEMSNLGTGAYGQSETVLARVAERYGCTLDELRTNVRRSKPK